MTAKKSLHEQLDAYKNKFKKTAPAEARATMDAATESLKQSGILSTTIKVGDQLPQFTLRNQDGEPVSSSELLRQGPLVINFFRGIWCPYCNIELEVLNEALPQFEEHGASLVTIAPQLEKSARRNKSANNLDFDILVDEGNRFARELGIVFAVPDDLREIYSKFNINLPQHNGDDSWTLPMPARLLVNTDGVVVYANINPDYTTRPEPEEIVDALQQLELAAA